MRSYSVLTLISVLALPVTGRAQDSTAAPAGLVASKGVYSAGQADRGDKVFQKICIECHEPFEFSGSLFDKAWLGRTAFDFFDLVTTTMPDDKPGTLNREDVVDVLAYILRLNAYPAGTSDLPNDDAKLKQIQIDAKPPAPSSPPNARR